MSLIPATQKITKADSRPVSPGTMKASAKTGTSRIRRTVNALGKRSMGVV
jgi:hypothetical protein